MTGDVDRYPLSANSTRLRMIVSYFLDGECEVHRLWDEG